MVCICAVYCCRIDGSKLRLMVKSWSPWPSIKRYLIEIIETFWKYWDSWNKDINSSAGLYVPVVGMHPGILLGCLQCSEHRFIRMQLCQVWPLLVGVARLRIWSITCQWSNYRYLQSLCLHRLKSIISNSTAIVGLYLRNDQLPSTCFCQIGENKQNQTQMLILHKMQPTNPSAVA